MNTYFFKICYMSKGIIERHQELRKCKNLDEALDVFHSLLDRYNVSELHPDTYYLCEWGEI
jgi:hypothetical protein